MFCLYTLFPCIRCWRGVGDWMSKHSGPYILVLFFDVFCCFLEPSQCTVSLVSRRQLVIRPPSAPWECFYVRCRAGFVQVVRSARRFEAGSNMVLNSH